MIQNSTNLTWEKTVKLAVFVAKNIPHDNQKKDLKEKNAILLSELLLAVGIKNCFVTCLPEDGNDGDCHVVNLVWLPDGNIELGHD